MLEMRKYPKVLNLGHDALKNLFKGKVELTEKLDGSQFRLILTHEDWNCGSKNVWGKEQLINNKQFEIAVKKSEELWQRFRERMKNVKKLELYMEYMQKERHNTLEYGRIPKNHFYLFGAFVDGKVATTDELKKIAEILEIDPPNVMFVGEIKTQEQLEEFLEKESYLGGKIEGIVIKNYNQTFPVDLISTQNYVGFPLVGKLVREEFREVNMTRWQKIKKPLLERLAETFITEERFRKVIQHLKEEDKITHDMRDLRFIGPEFIKDLWEEERENILKMLEEEAYEYLKRRASKFVVKQYKQYLMEKQFENSPNSSSAQAREGEA